MNARMCEQTFGRTNMHADRQSDRQTDGRKDGRTLKHTISRTRACKHTNVCIDERTHVRSNIWTHELARGQTDRQTDRQTDGRTDGLTHTPSRMRACTHMNSSMLTHTHTMHSGTHARTDRHTHTCLYGGKTQVQTGKLEVKS